MPEVKNALPAGVVESNGQLKGTISGGSSVQVTASQTGPVEVTFPRDEITGVPSIAPSLVRENFSLWYQVRKLPCVVADHINSALDRGDSVKLVTNPTAVEADPSKQAMKPLTPEELQALQGQLATAKIFGKKIALDERPDEVVPKLGVESAECAQQLNDAIDRVKARDGK